MVPGAPPVGGRIAAGHSDDSLAGGCRQKRIIIRPETAEFPCDRQILLIGLAETDAGIKTDEALFNAVRDTFRHPPAEKTRQLVDHIGIRVQLKIMHDDTAAPVKRGVFPHERIAEPGYVVDDMNAAFQCLQCHLGVLKAYYEKKGLLRVVDGQDSVEETTYRTFCALDE